VARESLPVQTDALGREAQGSRFTDFFDPTLTRADRQESDPLLVELRRRGVGIETSPRHTNETRRDYAARMEREGRTVDGVLRQVISRPSYQSLDDTTRARVLSGVSRYAQKMANSEMVDADITHNGVVEAEAEVRRQRIKQSDLTGDQAARLTAFVNEVFNRVRVHPRDTRNREELRQRLDDYLSRFDQELQRRIEEARH